ncbi:MAG: hypothetical protein JSU70_20765 [Phycisphaerales bacterium]|nr:MAG: hypothetical protein JSU70_20765 [Phycisphaerales bacterium]
MAEKILFFEGKKFVWDGGEYDDKEKASSLEKKYTEKGFDVRIVREAGKTLLYTRRVVTEIVIE